MRFERKSTGRKIKRTLEEAPLTRYRGSQADVLGPVALSSFDVEDIRHSQDLDKYPSAFKRDYDVLQWACGMAGESPTARVLLREAQNAGWTIFLDDLDQTGFEIDEKQQNLTLDHYGFTADALGRSGYFRNALFVNFVKALREIWHERNNHSFEKQYRPDAVLMLERARAADCETIAILAGWELRGAGHTDIWRYILGSEEGDMAMIFTRAIEKDPAGFYDGSVLARTFCQWYGDDERVANTDHAILERMDSFIDERGGGQAFGGDPLHATTVEKLSLLPGQRAYLAGMGKNIATDPYFLAMKDVINESHLFQIVYDSKVVMAGGVPFRDSKLARLIFPAVSINA